MTTITITNIWSFIIILFKFKVTLNIARFFFFLFSWCGMTFLVCCLSLIYFFSTFCLQQLSRHYMDTALLVWNGTGSVGKDQIQKFLESLPTSQHSVTSLDSQPVLGKWHVSFSFTSDHVNLESWQQFNWNTIWITNMSHCFRGSCSGAVHFAYSGSWNCAFWQWWN